MIAEVWAEDEGSYTRMLKINMELLRNEKKKNSDHKSKTIS